MRLADGLAGTPRRAALLALAILVAGLALTGFTLHRLVAAAMLRELEAEIQVEADLYRELLDARGPGAMLVALGRAASRGVAGQGPRGAGDDGIAAAYAADGARLAGRGPSLVPGFEGRGIVRTAEAAGRATRHLALVEPAGSLTLVVGRGTAALERVLDALGLYLALAGRAVTTLCLAVARALARRTRARLGRMAATLDRVARGELDARLATGTGDPAIDRVSARINAHLAELARSVEGTRGTVRAIAHDLRTPLSRAGVRLQQAAAALDEGAPALALVEAAGAELDTLGEVFDTILRIGRIRASKDREGFERVRLDGPVREIGDVYEAVVEAAGQRLVVGAGGADAPAAFADRRMLRQLLANLVENAVRHCPPGTTIRIDAGRAPDGGAELVVDDDGPGVPEAERRAVLEPFHRLDASRNTPGSGLGLALVDAVARRHGATLRLDDARPGLRVAVGFPPVPPVPPVPARVPRTNLSNKTSS